MRKLLLPLFALTLIAGSAFAGNGKVIIQNADAAGTGFNDPTPATPVGGNPGTTLGEQRLNVFKMAAQQWSNTIDTNVDVIVSATFAPIIRESDPCTADAAILGAAGPVRNLANFTNSPKQNVLYPVALANKFANTDLRPGEPDISAIFNAEVDTAACLGASNWYYGYDGKHGSDIDLYVVVLHELAHGLGFTGGANLRTGSLESNLPNIFELHTFDTQTGQCWDQMSASQRRDSALNTGRVVWDGPATKAAAASRLGSIVTLTVTAPSAVAGNYEIGSATFGADSNTTAVSGRLVVAKDAKNTDGPTDTDGCSAFANASDISGNIAVVDRGSCFFVNKARNAQAAGASALIIVDNKKKGDADATCDPPGMGPGDDDASDIHIPVISLRLTDGEAIKAQAANGVNAMLRIDPSQKAGASQEGYPRLYAPCTIDSGSSIHHFDVSASPNLLMEPYTSSDLTHGVDLTVYQLIDIGWTQPVRTGRTILRRGK
ncbi:MAG TPA: PA domain-containing protein [Thermoanaerobaculia bacterium]|nr:PA domain-containing protein [Thermoanaerobaculia bacterium]